MDWRKTKEYRQWRVSVIRRDSTCVICGSLQNRQAHHVEDGSRSIEGRFDVANGVTLCSKCHTQFHTSFKNSFREKCSLKDWNNFVSLVNYIKEL